MSKQALASIEAQILQQDQELARFRQVLGDASVKLAFDPNSMPFADDAPVAGVPTPHAPVVGLRA
jgi:hypothetical protein